MAAQSISTDELVALEADVLLALKRRDNSGLNVLGFGEISLALGYPGPAPQFVCKRTPPFNHSQFQFYRQLVDRYVGELRTAGLSVVDTEVRAVARGEQLVAYLVQPLLRSETLGRRVLDRSEPDPEHPFLVALAETMQLISGRISIDAQITNWSWDDQTLTLLDVGTPFLWDQAGRWQFDIGPYLPMISAPLRSAARKDLTKIANRWQDPRGVALDIVANLYREGLEPWVEPTTEALNRSLGSAQAIQVEEAKAAFAEDLKTWPRLTRLKRLERFWQTSVRRRHYDFFIQSSFADGTIY